MPYNSETSEYERRSTTVIDATPDGDTVAVAIDVKLDQGIDDYVTDLNHHAANGRHYPATSVASDSRFLRQSPTGVVSWANGVIAADAALKDMSNVANGAIAPAKIAQDASNRFMTDTERTKLSGIEAGAQVNVDPSKSQIEAVLTGTITSHTHSAASESAAGLVELATTAEAAAGTDTSRAVTAAGMDAYHKAKNIVLSASAPASGVAVDFGSTLTPLPADIKRITVMLNGVSTNGTSNLLLQVGDTGGFETSGYNGVVTEAASMVVSLASTTSGWALSQDRSAAENIMGSFSLVRISGNTWLLSGTGKDGNWSVIASGSKTLSDTLDRVRITTVNGTDQFDAGTINISWEF